LAGDYAAGWRRELQLQRRGQVRPLLTVDRVNEPHWTRPGRKLYDGGSLGFLPGKESVPLLVDHDQNQLIGRVDSLWRFEWVDGPWLCASATLDAELPRWLKRGGGVSFGSKVLRSRAAFPGMREDVIAHAFVDDDGDGELPPQRIARHGIGHVLRVR
jgi:hypothetical protein